MRRKTARFNFNSDWDIPVTHEPACWYDRRATVNHTGLSKCSARLVFAVIIVCSWKHGDTPVALHDAEVLFALHVKSIAHNLRDANGRLLPMYFQMPQIGTPPSAVCNVTMQPRTNTVGASGIRPPVAALIAGHGTSIAVRVHRHGRRRSANQRVGEQKILQPDQVTERPNRRRGVGSGLQRPAVVGAVQIEQDGAIRIHDG